MQPSAGQDLPHTRTRPVHWLATALALAALVLGAVALRPPQAAADPPHAAAGPDPSAVRYPVNCAGLPLDVVARAGGDLDGDGRPDTVAVVRCRTEVGTPPSGVYVLSDGPAPGAPPRIVATLVSPWQDLSVSGLRIDGPAVSATLLGYSSSQVPRCCPDLARRFTWTWRDGGFAVSAGPGRRTGGGEPTAGI